MIEILRTMIGLVKEIKSLFFNTLYLWTVAFAFLLVISFHNFLVLFAHTN
jgi:hypothetical protein